MSKTLKHIAWYVNFGFTCIPTVLVVLPLIISSLVAIIFSHFLLSLVLTVVS